MPLRLLEITLSRKSEQELMQLLEDYQGQRVSYEDVSENNALARIVLHAEEIEQLTDALESHFSGQEDFRMLLLPVDATLPRLPEPSSHQEAPTQNEKVNAERVWREELYDKLVDGTRLNTEFLLMTVLSTIVAAIGLIEANTAAIIGAMVIAPLLGPNVALALGVTLGDGPLVKKALRIAMILFVVALAVSLLIGLVLNVDPSTPEIASRVKVGLGDIALALAAGAAATLAFAAGKGAALIGVMVAVALLPPLAAFGLLIGSGQLAHAWGALLLLAINVICINLSGVLTFLFQGVHPLSWWEKSAAKKYTRQAIIFWVILLLGLALVIWFIRNAQS